MKIEKELKIAYEALERIENQEPNSITEAFEKMQDLAKIRKLIKALEQKKQ